MLRGSIINGDVSGGGAALFIDIEGIDGFGRSALTEAVTARLTKLGYRVSRGEQPPGVEGGTELTSQARFFLEVAKTSQLLESFIRPTLARGEVAVTSGYVYGPLASACARGVDRYEALEATAQVAAQGMWPDLVILLDTSPSIAALRASAAEGSRGCASDAFVRESLLDMARRDPHRFVVVDCDFVRADALTEQVLEIILCRLTGAEGEVRPKQSFRPNRVVNSDLSADFFESIDALLESDGPLGLIALQGVGGPAAHQRRLRFVDTAPQLVARSLRGVSDDESWTLRELLCAAAPDAVIDSLEDDGSPRALRLRAQLIDAHPGPAVKGLAGDDSPQAWWLREQALRAGKVNAVLESLAGLDSPRAWRVRSQSNAAASTVSLIRSLRGLSCPKAEALRDRHASKLPLEVLASTEGVDTRAAAQLRGQLFGSAPGAVVSSLLFVDSAQAWELREKAAPRCPEALLSTRGMSCEAAWSLRERYAARWPAEAIGSLGALTATTRGAELIDRALRSSPDLFALRAAYIARKPVRESRTSEPAATAAPPMLAEAQV